MSANYSIKDFTWGAIIVYGIAVIVVAILMVPVRIFERVFK